MKKYLVRILCLSLLSIGAAGCGEKANERPTNRPAAGSPEEVADSTRLDSAGVESSNAATSPAAETDSGR